VSKKTGSTPRAAARAPGSRAARPRQKRGGLTAADFRRIALGLKGAGEGAHMGHPDFRVAGKIFATLQPRRGFGMVNLTPDEQHEFQRAHPDAFTPEAGAWGRTGSTRVLLGGVDEETLAETMTLAWQHAVAATAKNTPRAASAAKAKRPSPAR
jgi:hypothetical protein